MTRGASLLLLLAWAASSAVQQPCAAAITERGKSDRPTKVIVSTTSNSPKFFQERDDKMASPKLADAPLTVTTDGHEHGTKSVLLNHRQYANGEGTRRVLEFPKQPLVVFENDSAGVGSKSVLPSAAEGAVSAGPRDRPVPEGLQELPGAGDLADLAALTVGLQRHLRSGCVVILVAGRQNGSDLTYDRLLLRLQRLLAQEAVATTVLNIEQYRPEVGRCTRNRPIHLFLSPSPTPLRRLSAASLSGPVWLQLLGPAPLERQFGGVHIPFNCQFVAARRLRADVLALSEVYRVTGESRLQISPFGRWSPARGLESSLPSLYDRRSNLQGLLIKAATIHNPPTIVTRVSSGRVRVDGFFGRVWDVLEQRMNFSTNFSLSSDGTRGTLLDDGSYNGMLRMILDGDVHMAVDAFGMSQGRLAAVDFTSPIVATKYCIFLRRPDGPMLVWDSFLAPFSPSLWLATGTFVFSIACTLTTLYWLSRGYADSETSGPWLYSLYNSFYYCWGVLCQQGHEVTPRSNACRVVYITAYLTTMVLSAAYSATLVSFLTVNHYELPFTDLKSLLRGGRYTFQMLSQNSASYFSNATREVMLDHYAQMSGEELADTPTTVLQGLQRICSSEYALLIPLDAALALRARVSCRIVQLPQDTSQAIAQGFTIAKHSPYRDLFDHTLLVLRAGGILQKHRMSQWPRGDPTDGPSWSNVTLLDAAPMLCVLGAGVLVALSLLAMERWVNPPTAAPRTPLTPAPTPVTTLDSAEMRCIPYYD